MSLQPFLFYLQELLSYISRLRHSWCTWRMSRSVPPLQPFWSTLIPSYNPTTIPASLPFLSSFFSLAISLSLFLALVPLAAFSVYFIHSRCSISLILICSIGCLSPCSPSLPQCCFSLSLPRSSSCSPSLISSCFSSACNLILLVGVLQASAKVAHNRLLLCCWKGVLLSFVYLSHPSVVRNFCHRI